MQNVSGSPELSRLNSKLGVELLWLHVLSLLRKGPSHAYVLRRRIMDEFGFTPGNVSAYVVLYKLKARGYVSRKKEKGRSIYTITAKGVSLLENAKQMLREKEKLLFS